MAKYEFGIMEAPPEKHIRYDAYDTEKFQRLIAVTDDYFEPFLPLLKGRLYLHTTDIESNVIEWTGINLIPPETCYIFAEIIKNAPPELFPDDPEGITELCELKDMFETAYNEKKFVKIFGL